LLTTMKDNLTDAKYTAAIKKKVDYREEKCPCVLSRQMTMQL